MEKLAHPTGAAQSCNYNRLRWQPLPAASTEIRRIPRPLANLI